MLDGVKNFIYRHRKKLIFTGVFVGGVFVARHYFNKKIGEWQEAMAKDYVEKTRRKFHFENTEKTCDQTTESLAVKLRNNVLQTLNTELLIESLRNEGVDKVKTWEELKVKSFTRVAVIIYSEVMLAIIVRIQVNIIGGQTFGNTVVSNELQEKYLTYFLYLLNDGIDKLKTCIESKVKPIIEKVSLKQKVYLKDLQEYFWMIQSALSSSDEDPLKNIASYVFPPDILNEQNPVLKTWLQDTLEILNGNDVQFLATSCINHGFSVVMDAISREFFERARESSKGSSNALVLHSSLANGDSFNFHNVTMPMAKVIPIVNGLLKLEDNVDSSIYLNFWINLIISYDKIKVLGSYIYEGFSQPR